MKTTLTAILLVMALLTCSGAVLADQPEPAVYVVKKGDTLWGLSDRFIKDPHYWPNMWASNPAIGNPHFIYPGQQVKVYKDRIVVEQATVSRPAPQPQPQPVPSDGSLALAAKAPVEDIVEERTFRVPAGGGYLLENGVQRAGTIIATQHDRQLIGRDDVAYTDIGRRSEAKAGDRFLIYADAGAVSHPVTNEVVGHKMIPLGTLQLLDVERGASKAIVTASYMEIGRGALLLPFREKKREVALKASTVDRTGYIVDSQAGTKTASVGDIVFLDMGSSHGVEAGNMLYVCRDVVIDKHQLSKFDKVPEEVIGALVVVETGERTSSAVVVKGVDAIYLGDRVALKKAK